MKGTFFCLMSITTMTSITLVTSDFQSCYNEKIELCSQGQVYCPLKDCSHTIERFTCIHRECGKIPEDSIKNDENRMKARNIPCNLRASLASFFYKPPASDISKRLATIAGGTRINFSPSAYICLIITIFFIYIIS